MPPKSRKRPKVKPSPETDEGYSLWNPPPGWTDRKPFEGRRSLVDPNVTPEQIRAAMDKAKDDPVVKAMSATMTHEQMMRPVCGPGEPAPRPQPKKLPERSEEWLQGFREGRASGRVSERIRIARMAYAEGNPIAAKLDPEGVFSPENDPDSYV